MTGERMVIVGGSLAGLRAAQTLRRQAYDGTIIVVDADPNAGYDRPPLSKGYLAGTHAHDDIRLVPGDLDVTWLTDLAAAGLDTERGRLMLSDGSDLAYDGLVLACGARARQPVWAQHDGVHLLRSLADATTLHTELTQRRRVTVVGGGFIGCEVAATARSLGCEVTILDIGPTLLHQAVGPAVGDRLAALHRDHGVDIRTHTSLQQWHGDERVEAVRLSTGELLPCEVVVLGLGAVPNTEWLRDSGVALDDGIRCDEALRTSAPGVVAAGDAVSWPNPMLGGRRQRVEHWTNASSQGAAAAKTLLHGDEAAAFSSIPTFWSDQYDVKINAIGWPELASEPPHLHTDAGGAVTAEYHRDGALTGLVTWGGSPAKLAAYRRQIQATVQQPNGWANDAAGEVPAAESVTGGARR